MDTEAAAEGVLPAAAPDDDFDEPDVCGDADEAGDDED
jgi:hypothetical protein